MTLLIACVWIAILADLSPHVHTEAASGLASLHMHHTMSTPGLSEQMRHLMSGAHGAEHGFAAALSGVPAWTVMSIAMMMPVALPALRYTGLNSLAYRRYRAIAIYALVYTLVWVAFGALALAGGHLVRVGLGSGQRWALVASLAVAASWQLSRPKRRALNACRRTVPLPPIGARADAGCARFALLHGWRCTKSCWALMVVVVLAGHSSLLLMAVLTAWIAVEELTSVGRRLLWLTAATLAAGALLVAAGI